MLSRWTCKRCVPLLGAYNENALPERQAARVAAHLAACPACRAELAALQHVAGLLRGHRPPAPAPARDLWRRIQAEIAAPAPKRSPVWPVATALGAAALVLLTLARPWPSGEPERAAAPQTAAVPAPAVSGEAVLKTPPRPDPFTPRRENRRDVTASAPAAKPSRARVVRAPRKARDSSRGAKASIWVKREPPVLSRDRDALPKPAPRESLPIRTENPVPVSLSLLARARDANAPAPEAMAAALPAATAAAPPAATAAAPPAADIAPPTHVSAAASAVDEALGFERQRELFRYSRFSQR